MNIVEQKLYSWKNSLYPELPTDGLRRRNPTVHKWKAPFRSIYLREAVFWRLHDLLTQSYALYQLGHALGARILLRSSLETLAMLIRLNQLTSQVLGGTLDFHVFSEKTTVMLLVSRNETTNHEAVNIVTVLSQCDKRYPGLSKIYEGLSELAHPNYEGMVKGYSILDRDNDVTIFSNPWSELYEQTHLKGMEACISLFEEEYNEVWASQFASLEEWIENNDGYLEETKGQSS